MQGAKHVHGRGTVERAALTPREIGEGVRDVAEELTPETGLLRPEADEVGIAGLQPNRPSVRVAEPQQEESSALARAGKIHELAKGPGGGRELGVGPPGETDIHGRDVVLDLAPLQALAL